MRGEVLQYDESTEAGVIGGDDGLRYDFHRRDLLWSLPITPGTQVAFTPASGVATQIFIPAAETAAVSPAAPATPDRHLSVWDYFVRCLRKALDGSGRARRTEFWSFVLFATIYLFGAIMFDMSLLSATGMLLPIATGLGLLVLIPAKFAVGARRLHDLGLSGWLVLLSLIPSLGMLFMLVIAVLPSQEGGNAYGPSPKLAAA